MKLRDPAHSTFSFVFYDWLGIYFFVLYIGETVLITHMLLSLQVYFEYIFTQMMEIYGQREMLQMQQVVAILKLLQYFLRIVSKHQKTDRVTFCKDRAEIHSLKS